MLSVRPFMSETFSTYPLAQPIYHKLSWKEEAMTVEEQTQSNPSLSNPSNQPPANTPLDDSEPSASSSQKGDVTKKKKKKKRTLEVIQ